ncbi:copper-binding protein [Rubrivivax sp. RP6-9]|uniref:copper-binding protein n=1 Tax=Rubrivivax sp. RP6-9 TaxID=3415750 RepID=UPI003CC5057E
MRRTLPTLLLSALLALPALAQTKSDMTDGEVRKIDKDAAKVTLRHGEIKSLDMPPMTMVFHVKERALLDRLKAGDKVRFAAVHEGGKYTVTEIQVVP